MSVSTQQLGVLGATAAVSAAVGSVVTYFVVRKRFEENAKDEIQKAKHFYMALSKQGDYSDPSNLPKKDEVLEEAVEAMRGYAPTDEQERSFDPNIHYPRNSKPAKVDYANAGAVKQEPAEEPDLEEVAEGLTKLAETNPERLPKEVVGVFAQLAEADGFDFEAELERRSKMDPNAPRLITKGEFDTNIEGSEQDGLAYYMDDDVLADSREMPTDEEMVGAANLARFGEGSGHPNVVYVYNPAHDIMYEITRIQGSFAQLVHGVEPEGELRHSATPRKMRHHHE